MHVTHDWKPGDLGVAKTEEEIRAIKDLPFPSSSNPRAPTYCPGSVVRHIRAFDSNISVWRLVLGTIHPDSTLYCETEDGTCLEYNAYIRYMPDDQGVTNE